MRALALAALLLLPVLAAAHSDGRCPARTVTVLVGDGVVPGSLYRVQYEGEDDLFYAESGRLPGYQGGVRPHYLLDYPIHDHHCYNPLTVYDDIPVF
jgi:hypothetical protein